MKRLDALKVRKVLPSCSCQNNSAPMFYYFLFIGCSSYFYLMLNHAFINNTTRHVRWNVEALKTDFHWKHCRLIKI